MYVPAEQNVTMFMSGKEAGVGDPCPRAPDSSGRPKKNFFFGLRRLEDQKKGGKKFFFCCSL